MIHVTAKVYYVCATGSLWASQWFGLGVLVAQVDDETCEQNQQNDDRYDETSTHAVIARGGGRRGHEWVDTSGQLFITDVTVVDRVLANVNLDSLVNTVNILVTISESTEELLEEHTAKVDGAWLDGSSVQVVHIDLADWVSARLFDLFGESRQWNTHVVATVLSGEIESEVVVVQFGVVWANIRECANSINGIVAWDLAPSHVGDKSNEFSVDRRGKAESFEVCV